MDNPPAVPPDAAPGAPAGVGLMGLGFFTQGAAPGENGGGETAGGMVDRYELIEPVGEGGFGVVWRARQYEPIRREVALKVIKPGLGSREAVCRFEAERQALALMDHPNIAAVLDAGATADGRPYFVMELVQGIPLTAYCDQHQLSLCGRLGLFIPVCQAVQHAHQKAVLHRDLKPSNILVTEIDGKPVPKVIDFGIAKALGPADGALSADLPDHTLIGTVVGTPRYMSPEQAGCGLDVDTRSDVYSLGVVLCELLTGQTPQPAHFIDLPSALRAIIEAEPVRPSTLVQIPGPVVQQAASLRRLGSARFSQALRGDLDWIALKAMEKDRTRRYETATALARDLERHLEGKTVSAAAPTWSYQLGKFTKRHRAALVAAGFVTASLVTGTGVSLWQAREAETSRAEAVGSRMEAEANYARARQAVEQYLSRVTDHPRLQQSDFQDLQRELLETALPLYEEISRSQAGDPKLRHSYSVTLGRLAHLYHSIGALGKSEHLWRRSLEMDEKLAAEFPEHPFYRHSLATRHHALGYLLSAAERTEEAQASFGRARGIFEELTAAYPDNPGYARDLASNLINLGGFLSDTQPEEARAVFDRATAMMEKLVSRFPDVAENESLLAMGFLVTGDLCKSRKDYSGASAAYLKGIAVQGKIVREHPPNREFRRILAYMYACYGDLLSLGGSHGESVTWLTRSTDLGRKLVDEFPTYNVYRESLISSLQTLSAVETRRGRGPESLVALEQVADEQERLLAAVPGSGKFAKGLHATRSEIAARTGRPVPPPPILSDEGPQKDSPRAFQLDYRAGPDPGIRQWLRNGDTWTETPPNGKQSHFTVIEKTIVGDLRGTVIRRTGSGDLTLFVPDLGTGPVSPLLMKKADGTWPSIGQMLTVK